MYWYIFWILITLKNCLGMDFGYRTFGIYELIHFKWNLYPQSVLSFYLSYSSLHLLKIRNWKSFSPKAGNIHSRLRSFWKSSHGNRIETTGASQNAASEAISGRESWDSLDNPIGLRSWNITGRRWMQGRFFRNAEHK